MLAVSRVAVRGASGGGFPPRPAVAHPRMATQRMLLST